MTLTGLSSEMQAAARDVIVATLEGRCLEIFDLYAESTDREQVMMADSILSAVRSRFPDKLFAALAAAGLVITAPDAPSGTVCISLSDARLLSSLFVTDAPSGGLVQRLRATIAAAGSDLA